MSAILTGDEGHNIMTEYKIFNKNKQSGVVETKRSFMGEEERSYAKIYT